MDRENNRANLVALAAIVFALIAPPGVAGRAAAPESGREMAVTIDDLPWVGDRSGIDEIASHTSHLLDVLKKHGVRAMGFVNENKLHVRGEVDARIALLEMWLDRGMPLGNHTYSHPRFFTTPLEDFKDEVIRGEVVTRMLMRGRGLDLKYFRHPYTSTGPTLEARAAFESFLTSRGYVIAPFTLENSDWLYNRLYVRALREGDAELARRLSESYLEHTEEVCSHFEKYSRYLLGYEVPQILLIHANRLNRDHLDVLLRRLKSRGYSFVDLEEAMKDGAYDTPDKYVGPMGISWLNRWAIHLGKEMRLEEVPDPPNFVLELHRATQ